MDGAASVFAAVSLAIQLAENMKKLNNFWKSVQDAPKDVHDIIADLDLLSPILDEIGREAERDQSHSTIESALRGCVGVSEELAAIVDNFQHGFASDKRAMRKWMAIKCARKIDKLSRFQNRLERLKTILMLALQSRNGCLSRLRDEEIITVVKSQFMQASTLLPPQRAISMTVSAATDRLSLQSLATDDSSIVSSPSFPARQSQLLEATDTVTLMTEGEVMQTQICQTGASSSQPLLVGSKIWKKQLICRDAQWMDTIFGSANIVTATRSIENAAREQCVEHQQEEKKLENQFSVLVQPAEWLKRLGVACALRMSLRYSSIEGLSYTLNSLRLVPDDATIFELCWDGNLTSVRELLASGEASVRDTNRLGFTPLHCAAECYHLELCKLLISAGADKTARGKMNDYTEHADWTPLKRAMMRSRDVSELGANMEIVRLFFDTIDFSDTTSDGWSVVQGSVARLETNRKYCRGYYEAQTALLWWVMELVLPDMKVNFDPSEFRQVMSWSIENIEVLSNVLKALPAGGMKVLGDDGNDLLLEVIAEGHHTTGTLLLHGADPHYVGWYETEDQHAESATSMAMYNSWTFSDWLRNLAGLGLDLDDFLTRELRTSPLTHRGWVRGTLQTLFRWDFETWAPAHDFWQIAYCDDCYSYRSRPHLQPLWLFSLNEIKLGKDPSETEWALRVPLGSYLCNSPETSGLDVEYNAASSAVSSQAVNDGPSPDQASSDINAEDTDAISSNSGPDSDIFSCPYTECEYLCLDCWLAFCKTGKRTIATCEDGCADEISSGPDWSDKRSSDADTSSEDDYSPFSVHW